MSEHTLVIRTTDKHPIEEIEKILGGLIDVEVLQRHDEHMLERGEDERAPVRVDEATHVGDFPLIQLASIVKWLVEPYAEAKERGDVGDEAEHASVRLWRLDDRSIDVHIADVHTNIDADGTVRG